MNELYEKVLSALQKEDKETALKLSIDALKNEEISVVELYEGVLTPALAHVVEEYEEIDDLIWREHVRSGIIRTIIESAYPFVLEARDNTTIQDDRVIVMCPEFEEHELGARMVADFFRIEGFDTTFVGARTPLKTVLKAIEVIKPKYLVVSVTNFFNILSVKNLIDAIKNNGNDDLVFVLGGRAVSANPVKAENIGADILLQGHDAIVKLRQEAN